MACGVVYIHEGVHITVCVCVLRGKVERGDVALPSVEQSLPLALFPAS